MHVAIPDGCPTLTDPASGDVNFNSTEIGSMANYSCNEGFILNGNATRICQDNGEWSGDDPTCQRKNTLLHAIMSQSC